MQTLSLFVVAAALAASALAAPLGDNGGADSNHQV